MAFKTGNYAKIWNVNPNEKYTDIRITTSRKNKKTNEYVQDFGGWCRLIGDAHKNSDKIMVGGKIKIGECECDNSYDKEKDVTYYHFKIFSFEPAEGVGGGYPFADAEAPDDPKPKKNKNTDTEDDAPF